MTFLNLRWTSGATAGAYDIEVAGEEIFAGTGEGEVTGVGEDDTTVVKETMFVGLNTGVLAKIPDG